MSENAFGQPLAHQRGMVWWIIAATSAIECLLWAGSYFTLYWFVPTFVDKYSGIGVEIPGSMVTVISGVEFAVNYWWIAIPALLTLIVVPKVVVPTQRYDGPLMFLLLVIGACLPIAVCLYGTGLPKLLKHGLMPL